MSASHTGKLLLVVAAALINAEGHILLAQRLEDQNLGGLWEFPGGKLEAGETPEEALIRELYEELEIKVAQKDLIPLTFASHNYPGFNLLMPLYLCRNWQGTVKLRTHQALKWVHPAEINQNHYPMPDADIPLIPFLIHWLDKI